MRDFMVLVVSTALIGCNGHPVAPLDEALVASAHLEQRYDGRARVDFLFVIDDSASMCEEQASLGRNIERFADFFVGRLGGLDFRVAVVGTDMRRPDAGRFRLDPVTDFDNCATAAGVTLPDPDTGHCAGLIGSGELDGILDADSVHRACAGAAEEEACRREEMGRRFRCLATLGAAGDGFEKGLESMRLALSCAGPNADAFGACCVDGRFDPACHPAEGGRFLRPDARLVVLIVSDEEDCSDPIANPAAASKAICRHGPVDADGDGLADAFPDAAAYAAECGDRAPEACFADCAVNRTRNASCAWERHKLTPVADYVRFLQGLKADPLRDVVVGTIVGERIYGADGAPLRYVEGLPEPACDPESPEYDPALPIERCCPDGVCAGPERFSCATDNGRAYAGARYLELAEAFDGVGCPEGAEGTAACTSICAEDFTEPFGRVIAGVGERLRRVCLHQPPACLVDGRPCATLSERMEPGHYTVRVQRQCDASACLSVEPVRALAPSEFTMVPLAPECPGGAAVDLAQMPPAGALVTVDHLVEVGG